MTDSRNMANARRNDRDEFYTALADIGTEISHYRDCLKNKYIYCNCDDDKSNFYIYFKNNFKDLELKHLTATHIDDIQSYRLDYDGVNETRTTMNGNGDFRSGECIDILKQCDIIINPPFSLWGRFFTLCMDNHKDILIIGNKSVASMKCVFPYFMDNIVSMEYTQPKNFTGEHGNIQSVNGLCRWITTLPVKRQPLKMTARYDPAKYPKFDNGDVINVDSVKDIPMDYYGVMGVPPTFRDHYDKEQFVILNTRNRYAFIKNEFWIDKGKYATQIGNKRKFSRILIRRIDV